jgi:MFS family permease
MSGGLFFLGRCFREASACGDGQRQPYALAGCTAPCHHPRVSRGVGDTGRNVAGVLKNRGLRRALLAFAVFRPTESAQWIAILVYAYRAGGTTEMGIAALALLVPTALLAPFVSQLGDRIHRERALALGYLAIGIAAGLTTASLALSFPAPVVYLFAALATISISMVRPTHLSILPELAETPAQLTAANAVTSTLEGFAIFIGPLLAGMLIALDGPKLVFGVTAAMMLAVGLLVLAVHARARMTEHHGAVGDALEGFRELGRRPGARLLLGFVAGQTVVIGALDVLTVVLAYGVLSMGPSGPGTLSAAVGVGGLVGAAATVTLIGRERLAPAFFLGVFAIGLPIALVAFTSGPGSALILLGVAGIGKSFFDVTSRTLLQRSVDDDVLARVFGVQEGLAMAALALGSVIAPIVVNRIGVDAAFLLAGLVLPALALITLERIRSVDRTAALADPADVALLRRTSLFGPMQPANLERVARHLVSVDVATGDTVIVEGDPGDRFYLIARGSLEVSRAGMPLAKLGPGDFVGEIALLRDVPRTATVVAAEPSSLRALDRDHFLAAVTGSPAGAVALAEEVDRRIAEQDD